MAVEHVFAPKDKPLGNLPLPTDAGKTILPAAWDGFKRCDLPMISDRNQIVLLGGDKVLQNTLVGGDHSGYSGTFRNEYYRDDFYYPGDTVYFELGFMLPSGFPSAPLPWGGLFQIHTPWTAPDPYDSPMFIIWPSAGKLRIRNDAEGGVDFETDWLLDRFHYWRGAITMGNSTIAGKPGHVKVWYSPDRRPTDAQVVVDDERNTCPPEEMHWSHNQDGSRKARTGSYEKNGAYLPPGTPGTFRHFRDAFVSSPAGLTRVDELFTAKCRPAALGGTPPPPPDTLPLTVIDDTNPTWVLVGWQPVPGCAGYRMRKDNGRWAHTWDSLFRRDITYPACNTRFAKPYTRLEVEALLPGPKGDLP